MEYILKNYMEDVIFKFLEKNLRNFDCCTCDRCQNDIAALALNNLPSKYAVTHMGDIYNRISSMEQQFEADFLMKVMEAVRVVRANPRHDG